jgi:hypothetical protein
MKDKTDITRQGRGSTPQSTALEASTQTITPLTRFLELEAEADYFL